MFEDLFKETGTIERYRAGPLAEQRLSYLRHLADSGASRRTLKLVAIEQARLVRLLDLTEGDTVGIAQIDAAVAEWSRPGPHRYHATVPTSAGSRQRVVRGAIRWLRFLGWLREPPVARSAYHAQLDAYIAWMREERGLSEENIRSSRAVVREFLDWLVTRSIPLCCVQSIDVDGAVAAKSASRRYSRATIRHRAGRLRAFFRFAEHRGWCRPGIAEAIIPPRVYPTETVPTGLSRPDVKRLLASTESNRPVDKRDRAILMLFITYGLRSGEVRRLQLEDLDWENETLRVRRSKSGRADLFPLSRGVGQAILRYILEVRPSRPERTLFFTMFAPIRPLRRGTIGGVVHNRLKRLGIVARHRGPHALRHAAAQHLLDQGMSMKVIGDFLGHRNPGSTAVYAKVDLNGLREVADFDLGDLA